MKYLKTTFLFIILLFFSTGCQTSNTDLLTSNLIHNRIVQIEESLMDISSGVSISENELAASNINTVSCKDCQELINSIKLNHKELFSMIEIIINEQKDILSEIQSLRNEVNQEKRIRVAVEQERNPREYRRYMEMRRRFEIE